MTDNETRCAWTKCDDVYTELADRLALHPYVRKTRRYGTGETGHLIEVVFTCPYGTADAKWFYVARPDRPQADGGPVRWKGRVNNRSHRRISYYGPDDGDDTGLNIEPHDLDMSETDADMLETIICEDIENARKQLLRETGSRWSHLGDA